MANEVPETKTVVEAENVVVQTTDTNAEAAIAAAKARADAAEDVAAAVTQAAINSEIITHTEELVEECQDRTQTAESVAQDALARMQALELSNRELARDLAERMEQQSTINQELLSRLEALTPAPSIPSPPEMTPEGTDPNIVSVDALPEAAEILPVARKARYRLM